MLMYRPDEAGKQGASQPAREQRAPVERGSLLDLLSSDLHEAKSGADGSATDRPAEVQHQSRDVPKASPHPADLVPPVSSAAGARRDSYFPGLSGLSRIGVD